MAEKRTLQKAKTRERIIDAALKVYSEQGFSAPTTAIANEAHVSHGSIFVHFTSVDNLLTCVLERFSQSLNAELHSLYDHENDLGKLMGMHIDVLIKYEDFYKRLVKEAVYLPEETRNTFIAIQSTLSIHFHKALEQDMISGKIKNVPFHMIFNTWLGLVHYYLLNSDLFAPRDSVLKRYKGALIGCFIALVKQ